MHLTKPYYVTGEMIVDYAHRHRYKSPKNKRIKRSPAKTRKWEESCETYRISTIKRMAETMSSVYAANYPYSAVFKAMIMGLDFLND